MNPTLAVGSGALLGGGLFGIIPQLLKRIQHPFFSWALIVSEWIGNRLSGIQWWVSRKLKYKFPCALFVALLNLTITSASAGELAGNSVWNILGNTGAQNNNLVAGIAVKSFGTAICDLSKTGDNLGNIIPETTKPVLLMGVQSPSVRHPSGSQPPSNGQSYKINFDHWIIYFLLYFLLLVVSAGVAFQIGYAQPPNRKSSGTPERKV